MPRTGFHLQSGWVSDVTFELDGFTDGKILCKNFLDKLSHVVIESGSNESNQSVMLSYM